MTADRPLARRPRWRVLGREPEGASQPQRQPEPVAPAGSGGAAFGRAALAHADALWGYARRLLQNDADAEELVQETYTRALAGAASFVGGSLKAWLFQILRNVFTDDYRRRRKQGATVEFDDDDGGAPGAQPFPDVGELGALSRVMGAEIEAALAQISDEARSIVLLDAEGFTEPEIARMLDCPLGTVKSRRSRARAALREKLKDYAR